MLGKIGILIISSFIAGSQTEVLKANMFTEQANQGSQAFETEMYVYDELSNFATFNLSDFQIQIMLPDQFTLMPQEIKNIKYPSLHAPQVIFTSPEFTEDFCFNFLAVESDSGQLKELSNQFQTAITNVNPAIEMCNQVNGMIGNQYEMSSYEFMGYTLDGQNYSVTYLVRIDENTVLHCVFNCNLDDKSEWADIAKQCFETISKDGD